jgi:hypothetical protein
LRLRTESRALRATRTFGSFTILALAAVLLAPLRASAQAPAVDARASQSAGDAYHRITLLDNPRVIVDRLTLQPGQRTDPPGKTHSDPRDVFVIQLTPGDIYMNTGEVSETGHQDTGKVWWISTPHQHSLANVGKDTLDIITIHLKEPFQASAQAPPPAAPAATSPQPDPFHRLNLLDNERVIAYRLTFQTGQRTDPAGRVHPDPRDGVVIMLTPGEIEFYTGEKIETGHQDPGKVWWMPKPPFLHSLANVGYVRGDDKGPWNIMVVSLK